MKNFFWTILISTVWAPQLLAATDYDNLCPANEVKLKSALPPILDQKRMNWCTTFACAAGLSYHARKQDSQLPETFVFSPFDINNIYGDGRINLENHLSLNKGGNIPELLGSLQKNKAAIKSDKKEPFPFTEKDKDLDKLVVDFEKKLDDYLAQHPDADVDMAFDIKPAHKGPNNAYTISKAVAHSRSSGSDRGVSVPRESIELGDRIPATPFPENYPDEARTSFSTQVMMGTKDESSYTRYFEKMAEVIQNDTPVFVDTCVSQLEKFRYKRNNKTLPKEWTDSISADPCGSHQMLAVGVKRDEAGKCVVVLQNSWGADWDDDGLVEIPFSELVKFNEANQQSNIKLAWVEAAPEGNTNNTLFMADNSEYTGPTKGLNPTTGEGRVKNQAINFSDGTATTYTGEVKTEETNGGYLVLRHGKGSSQSSDGLYQRGEYANGQFVSGLTKSKLADSSIFEGEYRNGRPTSGVITFSDGKVKDVRNGYIYSRGAPSTRVSVNAPSTEVVPAIVETTP